MLDTLQFHLQLSASSLAFAALVVLVAGMLRGFSGFGLSALVMAGLALLIPPIALIPVCFLLELVSGAVMFRGGLAEADRPLVIALVVGTAVGMPIGLAATHGLPPETSRLVALLLILFLAALQMFKLSPAFLGSKKSVYLAGLFAGMVTGLASIGGMVVALYILSLRVSAREVRASLVLYLFVSMAVSAFWLLSTGTLDTLAFKRGLLLAPMVVLGVFIGTWLFRPSLEPFYKRFCLFMLMSLAGFGLFRLLVL
ncbi:MAG: TSUP family transporter [Granulosicoccus sp.]